MQQYRTEPKFGDYCIIEQKRYGCPNEMYTYKVIGTSKSNSWVNVPVQSPETEVIHDHMEDVVRCICAGVDETRVSRFRISDVELFKRAAQCQSEGGLQWVKVADREPKLGDYYYCKINSGRDGICRTIVEWAEHQNGLSHKYYDWDLENVQHFPGFSEDARVIEWLDESSPSIANTEEVSFWEQQYNKLFALYQPLRERADSDKEENKEKQIAFAEWVAKNKWRRGPVNWWQDNENILPPELLSSSQLYELFLTETKQQ